MCLCVGELGLDQQQKEEMLLDRAKLFCPVGELETEKQHFLKHISPDGLIHPFFSTHTQVGAKRLWDRTVFAMSHLMSR